MVLVNMVAKWFKILDSLHGPMNEEMIEHASQLVEATKIVYHVNYSDSHRHITDYELMYVPIPKQTTGLVGFSFSLLMHQLSYVVIFICVFVLNSLFPFSALIVASSCSSSLSYGMEALSLRYCRI
jgi:hypothetical protein